MIYDAALLMASAQAYTLATPSTDYVDTLAAGNDYKGCIFFVQITTAAVTGSGNPTCQFYLQTASTTSFTDTDTITLAASAVYTTGQLKAGRFWHVAIPSGAKRYLRGFYQPVTTTPTNSFSAIAWNMFILEDIDVEIAKRRIIGSIG